ncbi:universal stress protein [Desulfosporosinus sp.]|uniref:universal stress protein n=1 Tax=Desulfosporosinus sp. TaxID=157907 RepID=UPI000E863ECC|nr:universal stress protein [Desulfosporosinus sp.]MBC2723907.1 universal stress protein [Desulfosporosinus sp.]MBC2725808.1 universal stress protein [Desulfosporosinus sp.]HBV89359.1 universal stress protein [Desulfosporosinus sp.]
MFKTILVPTDASEAARSALILALEIAKKFGSRILLLHVVYTPEALGYTLSSGVTVPQEEVSIYGGEVLAATLIGIDTGTVPLEKKQKPGHPASAILEEVKSSDVDLVVMGNRGYGPIAGSMLGSVSQRILSKAECPVMIAK